MIPELTGITGGAGNADPKEIAAKVQGMFVEVMLKGMEESINAEDGLFGSSVSSDMYRGMLREHLAKAMAEKNTKPHGPRPLLGGNHRSRSSRQRHHHFHTGVAPGSD